MAIWCPDGFVDIEALADDVVDVRSLGGVVDDLLEGHQCADGSLMRDIEVGEKLLAGFGAHVLDGVIQSAIQAGDVGLIKRKVGVLAGIDFHQGQLADGQGGVVVDLVVMASDQPDAWRRMAAQGARNCRMGM